MRRVYMDYAATTPVDPRVVKAMLPYFTEKFGNTMSPYSLGQEARATVEASRKSIAESMGAKPNELIFTSSASESNNFALKGVAFANRRKGKHLIISSIEHPCVMESANWLKRQGFELTKLPVDEYGLVDPSVVERSIRKDTVLVSIIHASNEIGTLEPIKEIGAICKEKGVYFHTDAAQSFGKFQLDVNALNVDLLTASSHKLYGPKGVACLYKRKGVKIEPILHGGGHEFGLRSSTVNVPGIVGFSEAVKLCKNEMKSEAERLTGLRDRLIKRLLEIEESSLNGHLSLRLPNNTNFSFAFVEGESIVTELDSYGVVASTGSACSSAKSEPSPVLLAIGLKPREALGSLRLTLGRWSKAKEVDFVLKILPNVIKRLRKISPFKR
jgi:cysteine desulfurase